MLSVGINLTISFRDKVKNVVFTDAWIHRQADRRTYKRRTNSDPKIKKHFGLQPRRSKNILKSYLDLLSVVLSLNSYVLHGKSSANLLWGCWSHTNQRFEVANLWSTRSCSICELMIGFNLISICCSSHETLKFGFNLCWPKFLQLHYMCFLSVGFCRIVWWKKSPLGESIILLNKVARL